MPPPCCHFPGCLCCMSVGTPLVLDRRCSLQCWRECWGGLWCDVLWICRDVIMLSCHRVVLQPPRPRVRYYIAYPCFIARVALLLQRGLLEQDERAATRETYIIAPRKPDRSAQGVTACITTVYGRATNTAVCQGTLRIGMAKLAILTRRRGVGGRGQ